MATGGLSEEQVEQLRVDVSAGRTPRVQISGSGAVTAGTVRAVGDPAADGDDYVTVRVKLNGVTDDLRYAPRELSRGRSGTKTASPTAGVAEDPTPKQRARPSRRRTTEHAPAAAPAPAAVPVAAPAATRSRKSSRRVPSTLPVTITFKSVDASWTVSAQRGARPIVKSAPVNPGVVSALAAMLDLPALAEAVAAVNDTARAEAESRAEQLRAELAELEAVLDSHRRP